MNDPAPTTVLVVEDDPGIALLERWGLELAGYQVLTVDTGLRAMEVLRWQVVDVVVLDYRLADNLTGLQLHERMRAAGFDQPVIMVTAYADETTTLQALRSGVRDFLPKSTEYLDYLPHAVDRVLEHDRAVRRLDAERAEKARLEGALLAAHTMQHHLSNQLSLTVGYAELLANDPCLPSHLQGHAEAALQGAEAAVRMLQQIQQITRVVERPLSGGPPILDLHESAAAPEDED